MGVPTGDSVHRDVIFVIDSSACLSGILPSLLKEYIQPCIEYFCGGKLPEVTYNIQNGPIRYGLVTINPPAATYRPVCTYYPITCSPAKLIKWIQDIRLEGGLVGSSLLLSEGLAAVMELAQLMESTREPCLAPDVTVEKHCVLVLNQPPSPHPCVESLKHAGKTAPQLIKLLIDDGIHISAISPRYLTSVRDLIEKTLPTPSSEAETTPLDELDHSLHTGHLILLQGFQIQAIKEKKKALLEEKMDAAEQATAEVAMDVNPPSIKIKDEPTPPELPVKVEPSFPQSNSPLTVSTAIPIKQEPPAEPPAPSTTITPFTSVTPSITTTPFTLLSSQPHTVTAGLMNPASGAAGSSIHNPIQITSPMTVPDNQFSIAFTQPPTSVTTSVESVAVTSLQNTTIKSETPPPFSTLPAQPTSSQSTPPLASSQSVPITRTASGGIPSLGGNQPNLEKAMKAAQMAVRMAQVSSQGSNNTVQQPRPVSVPPSQPQITTDGIGTGSQPNVGMGQNQQLSGGMQAGAQNPGVIGQPTQSTQPQSFVSMPTLNKNPGVQEYPQQRVPTPPIATSSVMSQPSNTSMVQAPTQNTFQQGQTPAGVNQPQQVLTRPTVIWNGIMEMADVHDNQRQMRQIRCSVSTNKADVVQEVQPQTWPQKMTMNVYPKAMFNSIMTGMDFNRGTTNLKTVNFQFQEQPMSVSMLRQLMVIDTAIKMFAIVHLVGANNACPIKALVLVWNEKQKQFTGLIPLEQEKFVTVVKQVLLLRQRQQQQQSGLQQSGGQNFSQPSSSFTQPSGLQQPQMSMAAIGQQAQGGMMRSGMMGQGQQQQGFSQGGMIGQQAQTQNQGGMIGQQSQVQGQGGLQTQNQGGMMGQQAQAQNQAMMGQQAQVKSQGGIQTQNQGGMTQGSMMGQQTQAQSQGGAAMQGQLSQMSQQQGGQGTQQGGQGMQQVQQGGQGMQQGGQGMQQGGQGMQQGGQGMQQGGQGMQQGGQGMQQGGQGMQQGGQGMQQVQQGGQGMQQVQQGVQGMQQVQQGVQGMQQVQQGQGMQQVQQGGQGMQQVQQGQGMQQVQQGGQGMQQGGQGMQQGGQGMQQGGQGMQQLQQGGQGMVSQQMSQPANQQTHQQAFGQGGTMGQQQMSAMSQQEKAEKFLKLLIQARPEQYDSLFQRLRITAPEQRQQWLAKASQYKQQLIQQQQQQQASNRMMMGGGAGQQGMQQQQLHGMQQPMNPGGQVFNRPGVPQSMGGMRPTNQMAHQQQQHMPPVYNQWQNQQH